MNTKNQKINTKLAQLGQPLGLCETDIKKARKTVKNMMTLALLTGMFILLGHIITPGGPVGLYYAGVSVKDFQILFGGFF